jgi:hypothetical protein
VSVIRALKAPPTSEGRPLGFTGHLFLFPPFHAAAYALRWVGMRDRLRCPSCKAVGTWKPHGTLTARWGKDHDRPVRRWMCKWCGLYVGPEGILRVYPDLERGWWDFPRPWRPDAPEKPGPTPADVIAESLISSNGKPIWPWRG